MFLRTQATHVVESAQLVVIAPHHHIIYISNGAREVVSGFGCLAGMPHHLRRSRTSRPSAQVKGILWGQQHALETG